MEARLESLLEQCTTALGRTALEGERAERALARFEAHLRDGRVGDGPAARVQHETAQRLQELERLVRQEWSALRDLHEEPLRELRQQAQQLTEVSLAAAHVAQQGFDAAEARLTAIEAGMQDRLDRRFTELSTEFTRELSRISREMREPWETWDGSGLDAAFAPETAPVSTAPSTPARVLPLRVVPEPLAQPAAADEAEPEAAEPDPADGARARAQGSQLVELSARLRELERTLEERQDDTWRAADRARRATRSARIAMGLLAVVVVAAIGVTLALQASARRRVDAAMATATASAAGATDRAGAEATAARAASARDAATARELAARTRQMSGILVAPDLVRRALYGTTPGSMAVAQVFWSRTRGVVVSASRVPAAPAGFVYQTWVLSSGDPASAGTLVPAADGTALLVADAPSLTSPFLGVVVTVEPGSGSPKPTGRLVLARYPTQPE